MGLFDGICDRLGIRSGSQTAADDPAARSGTVTPPVTLLAERSVNVLETDASRAPPTGGWLSSIRTWAAGLCCGFSRAKPVPHVTVHDALQIASKEPDRIAELAGKRIAGQYDFSQFSADRPAKGRKGPSGLLHDQEAFTRLQDGGVSLEHVKLAGEIRLPNPWNGKAAVDLLKRLAGGAHAQATEHSGGGEASGSQPDPTGVRLQTTSKGISVQDQQDFQLLQDALDCGVTPGRIKLTGKLTSRQDLDRVTAIIRRVMAAKGKMDLSGLTVSLDVAFQDPHEIAGAAAQNRLDSLQLLRAHGARIGELTQPLRFDLNEQMDPVPQLREWEALIDACHAFCAVPGGLLEGLELHAKLPGLLTWPQSPKAHDVKETAKLLARLSGAGAKVVLQGSVTFGPGQLDALHRLSLIPGVAITGVPVRLEREGAPFQLTRTQVRKLEHLHRRGAVIDDAIVKKARVGFGSKVL